MNINICGNMGITSGRNVVIHMDINKERYMFISKDRHMDSNNCRYNKITININVNRNKDRHGDRNISIYIHIRVTTSNTMINNTGINITIIISRNIRMPTHRNNDRNEGITTYIKYGINMCINNDTHDGIRIHVNIGRNQDLNHDIYKTHKHQRGQNPVHE